MVYAAKMGRRWLIRSELPHILVLEAPAARGFVFVLHPSKRCLDLSFELLTIHPSRTLNSFVRTLA